jgi:hypothetical protein
MSDKSPCEKCVVDNSTLDGMWMAGRLGHLQCMKILYENWKTQMKEKESQRMFYLWDSDYPWDPDTTHVIAHNGHLDCLEFAHTHGCPWNCGTTSAAARGGYLECLKYAHEHNCPWCPETTKHAGSFGHLSCLKYAHENNCEWHRSTNTCTLLNGYLECLKYACENGFEYFENDLITYSARVCSGKFPDKFITTRQKECFEGLKYILKKNVQLPDPEFWYEEHEFCLRVKRLISGEMIKEWLCAWNSKNYKKMPESSLKNCITNEIFEVHLDRMIIGFLI